MDIKKTILIILTCFTTIKESLVVYECSDTTQSIAEVSLIDVTPCQKLKRNITHVTSKIQLIQPKIYETVNYYQCLIEIDHIIYRCGKTFETFHKQGFQTELLTLNREECKHLIKTGEFKYSATVYKINKGLNINYISTETLGSIRETTCYPSESELVINGVIYDRPVRLSKFKIMTKESKGTIDIEEKKIILENGIKCKYTDLECFTATEGNVYWDSYFENPFCSNEKEYLVIYEGFATKITEYYKGKNIVSYLIHYNNYDFQIEILNKTQRICGSIAYISEHPDLAIVENSEYGFNLKKTKIPIGKNLNLMTYLNSKLIYIMRHTKDQINDLYEKLTYDRCLSETKIKHNMITLAYLYPDQFAFEYFGQSGYTAIARGEVLYLIKCQPISVNITRLNNNKCYHELPVLYNEKQYFMKPRTRILTDIGTEIDCSSLMNVKFKFDNKWYSSTQNGLIQTTKPNTLSIVPVSDWEFQEINKLAETGIYGKEDLDSFQKIILNPIQQAALTSNLQRSLSGQTELTSGYKATNLFSQTELESFVEKTAESTWKKLYSGITSFGNIFSFILGSFALLKLTKFILNMVINSIILYKNFGINWKLGLFWWENLVHHMIRLKNIKNPSQIKTGSGLSTSKTNEEDEPTRLENRELIPMYH